MSPSLALSIALRYVSMGRRSQLVSFMSLLTIAGLALSVAILVTVLSVMNGFDREMRENVLGILPHISVQSEGQGSAERWDRVNQVLAQFPELSRQTPLVETAGVLASARSSRGVLVNGIDLQQAPAYSALAERITAGSLQALGQQRFSIVLGESLATQLGVGIGDTVNLYSLNLSVNPLTVLPNQRQFTVVGLYRVGTQELDAALALIPLADARALFRVRAVHTTMRLHTDDVLAADQLARRIAPQLPFDFQLQTWTAQFGAIYENILLSRSIVGLLLWLLVAVAAFNLVVSLVMIVRDKRGDVAILRTMGASPSMIGRIFLYQGCMIGLLGLVIGLLLGVLMAGSVGDLVAWLEGLSGAQLLSAEVYPVDFLPSQLLLKDLLMISVGVLLLCLLASVYPAWRAARLQPAAALRLE